MKGYDVVKWNVLCSVLYLLSYWLHQRKGIEIYETI